MTTNASVQAGAAELLQQLGVETAAFQGGTLEVHTPITGDILARVAVASSAEVDAAIHRAHTASLAWRTVPAPRRGELVRLLGAELRAHLEPLAQLVTLEAGKILTEGRGEVQEMIDICTFAAGLSRQIGGLTLPSERPHHRMMETWHPLGVVGVISAFNFPVAVWAWNAALALVCGNTVVWKPSEKTPLTALAVQALFDRAAARIPDLPPDLSILLLGDRTVGEQMVNSRLIPLVSATGSTAIGTRRGAAACRTFCARDPRARWQQCSDHLCLGKPRSRAPRDCVCSDGHSRPAMHYAPSTHRAPVRL